jgi:hypothetical protein
MPRRPVLSRLRSEPVIDCDRAHKDKLTVLTRQSRISPSNLDGTRAFLEDQDKARALGADLAAIAFAQ